MSKLESIQTYWNRRAGDFSSSSLEELESEEGTFFKKLFCEKFTKPSAKILDCGSGAGFFTILLNRMGHRVTAVDYSGDMLKEARGNVIARGCKAEFYQMDAQRLNFEDETFDYIVSRNLFWNLEHPRQAYEEWYRVLKPGGGFINADGNYYLHGCVSECGSKLEKNSCHQRHNKAQVDFGIMDEIARELPLSRIQRPLWDEKILDEIGFKQISCMERGNLKFWIMASKGEEI